MSRTFRKNYPEKKASKAVRKFLDLANLPIEYERVKQADSLDGLENQSNNKEFL